MERNFFNVKVMKVSLMVMLSVFMIGGIVEHKSEAMINDEWGIISSQRCTAKVPDKSVGSRQEVSSEIEKSTKSSERPTGSVKRNSVKLKQMRPGEQNKAAL